MTETNFIYEMKFRVQDSYQGLTLGSITYEKGGRKQDLAEGRVEMQAGLLQRKPQKSRAGKIHQNCLMLGKNGQIIKLLSCLVIVCLLCMGGQDLG